MSKKAPGKLSQSLKGISQIIQSVTEKNAAADREKKKSSETKKRSRSSAPSSRSTSGNNVPSTGLPIGSQIRAVIEFVKQERRELSFKEVAASTKVSIDHNAQLFSALQHNEVVAVNAATKSIRYRPKYSISSRAELLDLIRVSPFGLNANELKDAYPQASADLESLAAEQSIFQCHSRDFPDVYIVYPNDIKLSVDVDEDMRQFLQTIEVPQEETAIEAALQSAGIKRAKRSTARLKLTVLTDNQPKVKKKKQAAMRRFTNAHMPELFSGDMATQID